MGNTRKGKRERVSLAIINREMARKEGGGRRGWRRDANDRREKKKRNCKSRRGRRRETVLVEGSGEKGLVWGSGRNMLAQWLASARANWGKSGGGWEGVED